MPEVNDEWIKEQLAAAKVKIGTGKAILKLLEAWSEIPELSKIMTDEVLRVFPILAKGHVILEEETEDDYMWLDLQPGKVTVGDVIRIKSDAFDADHGPLHNGRIGKVVGIRYGEIFINSTDNKTPKLEGKPYSPYKLEKRYRKSQ